MKHSALAHAKAKLERARCATDAIEASKSYAEFTTHWIDFLLAINGVYTKLSVGSRDSPKSQSWFSKKKGHRKSDSLLSYIHHARNADEHGVEEITRLSPGGIGFGKGAETISVSMVNGAFDVRGVDGKPFTVTLYSPNAELVTVKDDRFNDEFQPPKLHLGVEIGDQSPLGIAKLALAYMTSLVAEAEML